MSLIPAGILGVGLFLAVVLFGLAATDLLLDLTGSETIGRRLADWANRNPWAAVALAAVLGALVGHFFW